MRFGRCLLTLAIVGAASAQTPAPLRCVFLAEDGTPLANTPAVAEILAAPPLQGIRMGAQGMTTPQGEYLILMPDSSRPWWVFVGVPGAVFFLNAADPKRIPTSLKCWLGEKPSAICRVEGDDSKLALFLRLADSSWWVRLPPLKDGHLLLYRLPPGRHQLVLAPASVAMFWEGVPPLQTETLAVTDDHIAEATFTAVPMGSVTGTVVTSQGEPVGNATVTLERNGVGLMTVTTDPQGQFRIDAVPVGEYRLMAFARDHDTRVQGVQVHPDRTTTVVLTLQPQPLGTVRGRVISDDGTAIAEGRVLIERVISPTVRQPVGAWSLLPNGRFEGKLREGSYLLTVQVGGRRTARPVRVLADQVTDLGDLRLPAPALVEGIVKSAFPITNWRVRIVALDGSEEPAQPQWTSWVAEVPVRSDGRFQVQVPAGSLAVIVQPAGSGKPLVRRLRVRAGQRVSVQFTLPDFGSIEGQVYRADTGRPVPGAIVTLLDETGAPVAQTMTNPLGAYRFDPVLPGRYAVRCQGRGLAMGIRHEVRVNEGARVPVDFLLTTGATIVGKVRGQPAAPARFYVLVDADSNLIGSVAPDGTFRVDFIPPGRHVVMLFRLGEMVAAKEVTVHSGETAEVTFDLP